MAKKRVRWLWRGLALLAAAAAGYELWFLAQIWYWTGHNPATSAFMETRLEILREKDPNARISYQWRPYDHISVHLKRALIVAEDARFLDHEGFDWEGIQRAYETDLKKGKIVAGGSTISQQLAKNLFLSGARTPWRKAQEAVITLMLENLMSKRRIFEIYLNVIEWGESVFGAEAAARHYFGEDAADLSPEQAAELAAMLPRPRYYDRNRENSSALARKTAIIQERMRSTQVP